MLLLVLSQCCFACYCSLCRACVLVRLSSLKESFSPLTSEPLHLSYSSFFLLACLVSLFIFINSVISQWFLFDFFRSADSFLLASIPSMYFCISYYVPVQVGALARVGACAS